MVKVVSSLEATALAEGRSALLNWWKWCLCKDVKGTIGKYDVSWRPATPFVPLTTLTRGLVDDLQSADHCIKQYVLACEHFNFKFDSLS